MTASPDRSSYTWGLALIALALSLALIGAVAERIRPADGLPPDATVVADPMGFTMPPAQPPDAGGPDRARMSAAVAASPADEGRTARSRP